MTALAGRGTRLAVRPAEARGGRFTTALPRGIPWARCGLCVATMPTVLAKVNHLRDVHHARVVRVLVDGAECWEWSTS